MAEKMKKPLSKKRQIDLDRDRRRSERQTEVKLVYDCVHMAFFGMFPRLPPDLRGENG